MELYYNEDGSLQTVSTWHPVDGKWRRISQVLTGDDMGYFTDGERQLEEMVNKGEGEPTEKQT